MREVVPEKKPMFVRTSAVDDVYGGTTVEETVKFFRALKDIGIDVVDCSSGGISPRNDVPVAYGFQVSFAAKVRSDVEIATVAVGLIVDPGQAESILEHGKGGLDCHWPGSVGRSRLSTSCRPNACAADEEEPFPHYPVQAGWWLKNRQRTLARLGTF